MIPPSQGWQSYHDIALQPHMYGQPTPPPMAGLYSDYYSSMYSSGASRKRYLEAEANEGYPSKRIQLDQGTSESANSSRMDAINTMIASLYTVVAQLEETTREVITLSQERHAKYEEESAALKEENDSLQKQLEEEKQKKFDLASAVQDIIRSSKTLPTPEPDEFDDSPEKTQKMTQRYDEIASFATQALHQNKAILDELQTTRLERDRMRREFERERAAANKVRRVIEDNESLRASISTLRDEYERFKQLASTDKLIDLAQQNYNTVLRERDRLLVDKARLGLEMDKVTNDRDRLRIELLRAEREGFTRRNQPMDSQPVKDPNADVRNQRYWNRFKEGWEKAPERGQSQGAHNAAWGPVYPPQ